MTKLTLAAETVKPSSDRRKENVRKGGLNRISFDLIKDLVLEKVNSCKGEESGSAYPKEIQETSEQRVGHGISEPLEILLTVDPKYVTNGVINQQAPDWLEPLEEEDDPLYINSNSCKSRRRLCPLLQLGQLSPKRHLSPGAGYPVYPQLSKSLFQPISPTGIKDMHKKSQPIKSSVSRQDSSARPYHLRPVTKLPVKLSGVKVGPSSQSHCVEPVDSVCSKCGGSVPGLRTSGERVCPLCIPDKKQPPSIVFRKVGVDQWVVGRPECKEKYSSRKLQWVTVFSWTNSKFL